MMQQENSQKRARIHIPKKKKIAFVCSGGAAKAGAFHLGVALALQEKGFKFMGGLKDHSNVSMEDTSGRVISLYVGSSAGSMICSYLASGYTLEQIFNSFLGKRDAQKNERVLKPLTYRTMFTLRNDTGILGAWKILTEGKKVPATIGKLVQALAKDSYENLFKWKWLKWPGLFSTEGIERYLREDVLISNDFQNYAADLFIVATQLNHSRKVVFGKYRYSPPYDDHTVAYMNHIKVSEACAASTALPLIFSPYPIKNEKGHSVYYFDGEIRDTLSTHVAFDGGADLIIASYSHQPYHFLNEIGSLHQYGITSIMIQAIYLMIERKIQNSMFLHKRNQEILSTVSQFFKEQNLPEALRKQCVDLLERQLGHKEGIDYLYIHPRPDDHEMFFGDHFNLSSKKMTEIVRIGFKSAVDSLRHYEFE